LKKYLIDTNICIFYIKGRYELDKKFDTVDPDNCFISEITLAELKYGVENSEKKLKNQHALDNFLTGIKIIPIFHSLDLFAKEKSRLRKAGIIIDDFDLLIGATAITNNLVLVTNNTDHFQRLNGIILEDWTNNA
jgi:tRNA(fMet)-specific endonuclease VapC